MFELEQLRKERVMEFYAGSLRANKLEGLEELFGAEYQPNAPAMINPPLLETGVDSLRRRLLQAAPFYPTVFRIVADGDFVAAHVRYDGKETYAGIDLFQFGLDDKIVEHWNIRQDVADDRKTAMDRFVGDGTRPKVSTQEKREWQKQRAANLFREIWNELRSDRVTEYYVDTYIQHNPHIASGPQEIANIIDYAIRPAMAKLNLDQYPVRVRRILCEGDLLFVFITCAISGGGYSGVDIFRIDDDGKMTEHWDVMQSANAGMPDTHTFF